MRSHDHDDNQVSRCPPNMRTCDCCRQCEFAELRMNDKFELSAVYCRHKKIDENACVLEFMICDWFKRKE